MAKLGAAVSRLTFLGALGACLAGCPVWGDGSGGGVGGYNPDGGALTVDTPPINTSCSTNTDCFEGYCNTATRLCVTGASCAAGVTCPNGYTCDSRMVCVPGCSSSTQCPTGQYCNGQSTCVSGCSTNTDCTRLSPLLVCNLTSHQCAPSGGCTTDAQCASTPATPVCLGGSCQPRTSVCQFDYQCGGGTHCVDGQCVSGCSVSVRCAAGQVCTNNFCAYPTTGACATPCSAGQVCAGGTCLQTCSADSGCTTRFCDNGVCRVDTRPHPACTVATQATDCNRGSVCHNGACRLVCPHPGTGTDGGCMTADVQFDVCTSDNLCATSSEAMPQCARTAECSAGRACVNATCQ